MKKTTTSELSSFRAAIKTATKAARQKSFRKGFPVAVSKNGKVVLIYKDNREELASKSPLLKSK